MFKVENGIIKITKGDSAALTCNLKNADGTAYTMQTGDKLTLTVRKRPNTSVLMQIESTSNVIDFTPAKTKNLVAGACCYDIQLTKGTDIYTVAGLEDNMVSNMIVFAEVTE